MNNHPRAPLLRHIFILIPRAHLLLAEIAGLEIDILANGRQMLGEQHALGLQASVSDGITKQEAALFVGVAVEVEKGEELLSLALHQGLYRVAGRLQCGVGEMVESVQVLPQGVHSVVALPDSIGVQHGHDQEVKLISHLNSLILITDEEFEHTFQREAGSSFSWMNPRGNQH